MRCRVVRSARRFALRTSGMVTSVRQPTSFCPFSSPFHFLSFLAGPGSPNAHFPPAVSFESPRRLLLSVQAIQPFLSGCSESWRHTKLHTFNPLSLFNIPPLPLQLGNGPESFCFARSESNSFGIGRTDPASTSSVSASLCTISLRTTFLFGPYQDVIITYPTAGDKWSMRQSSQRRDFTDWVPCSISTSWHATSSRLGLCSSSCTLSSK